MPWLLIRPTVVPPSRSATARLLSRAHLERFNAEHVLGGAIPGLNNADNVGKGKGHAKRGEIGCDRLHAEETCMLCSKQHMPRAVYGSVWGVAIQLLAAHCWLAG